MNKKHSSLFSKYLLRHIVFSSFLEFGPVILFLASFEYLSIYESTVLLMLATIVSTFVTYYLQKRIPYLALYVALITTVFGYLTLHFHEVKFIQMRDTLYDATCVLTLTLGVFANIPFLKLAFGDIIPMSNRSWSKLTYLWITYFVLIAVANEFARRLFSVDTWFLFKGCIVVTTTIFGIAALYLSYEEKV